MVCTILHRRLYRLCRSERLNYACFECRLDFNKTSVVITFPQPVDVTHYKWATANDAPDRDPVQWSLEGSNDGNTWTTLDRTHATRSYATSSTRGAWQGPFRIDNSGAARPYELPCPPPPTPQVG